MKRIFPPWTYLFLSVLLLLSLAACSKQPSQTQPTAKPTETTSPTETTDASSVLTLPRIAATQEGIGPAWSGFYAATQLLCSDVPRDEILFHVDTQTALAGLADSTYDVIVLPCASGKTPDFGNYEVCPLFDDAIVFVHSNPTPADTAYDLSLETIRTIYQDGGKFYWDKEQHEPLVPGFQFNSLSQDLSFIFGIDSTADEIIFEEGYEDFIWSWDGTEESYQGSMLFPLYYSFLSGDAGINGIVISVDSVLPTDATVADGSYPLGVTYYAVYSKDDPDSARIAEALQTLAQ